MLAIESIAERIQQFANVAGLGRLTARLLPAEKQPGQGAYPAQFYITTEKPRPMNVGGGVVEWSGHVNVDSNLDDIAALNGLLSLVCEVITEAGRTAASVRNAYEDRRAAELGRATAERRLRATLTGRVGVTGEMYVSVGASGEAWLLDPVKREAGFGFCFASLGELWRTHPELRPVRWGADSHGAYLIVAPMAMAT